MESETRKSDELRVVWNPLQGWDMWRWYLVVREQYGIRSNAQNLLGYNCYSNQTHVIWRYTRIPFPAENLQKTGVKPDPGLTPIISSFTGYLWGEAFCGEKQQGTRLHLEKIISPRGVSSCLSAFKDYVRSTPAWGWMSVQHEWYISGISKRGMHRK